MMRMMACTLSEAVWRRSPYSSNGLKMIDSCTLGVQCTSAEIPETEPLAETKVRTTSRQVFHEQSGKTLIETSWKQEEECRKCG
jgi:hypothetical protein